MCTCLIDWRVVNDLFLRLVECDIQLETVECPRDEYNLTPLFVEWEMLNVHCTVHLHHSRKHPQHVTCGRNNRLSRHELLKAAVNTGKRLQKHINTSLYITRHCTQDRVSKQSISIAHNSIHGQDDHVAAYLSTRLADMSST